MARKRRTLPDFLDSVTEDEAVSIIRLRAGPNSRSWDACGRVRRDSFDEETIRQRLAGAGRSVRLDAEDAKSKVLDTWQDTWADNGDDPQQVAAVSGEHPMASMVHKLGDQLIEMARVHADNFDSVCAALADSMAGERDAMDEELRAKLDAGQVMVTAERLHDLLETGGQLPVDPLREGVADMLSDLGPQVIEALKARAAGTVDPLVAMKAAMKADPDIVKRAMADDDLRQSIMEAMASGSEDDA